MSDKSVLVVDDERWICQIVAEVLKSQGYEPFICTRPHEALDAFERESYPLAFIDISMPEMSGLDLASQLKLQDPHCEVVIMTAFASLENAIQAIKVGASDYIRKPFSTGEIGFCLRRYSERKALRSRLGHAEERYYRLVQNIPMLIFTLSRDLQLEFINQTCFTVLGFAPQEAMGCHNWLLDRVHPEERERISVLMRSAFASEQASFSAECRLAHKEGHIVHVLMKCTVSVNCSAEDPFECLEGLAVDITDRVLLEKTLVQREKLKTLGAISAEVAHEIRNPLVSIGGFARRLQKKFPDIPEVDIILRESERLEKILDRIRDYLRPVELRPKECSINEVVSGSVDLLSPEIRRKGLHCRLDLDESIAPVLVDPDILAEICINLIRNAANATASGVEVLIRTFQTDRNVHIDVKNETSGKKLKKPELLFLPFDEGGESIGLPLCYQLLKNMGGVISFVEERDHVVFTVSLPKDGEVSIESGGTHLFGCRPDAGA